MSDSRSTFGAFRLWPGLLALAIGMPCANDAGAAASADDAAERERIASERAVIETRYAEERLACQKNFVVTSCVDAARRREREELGKLRQQEALLDEAERRKRAADRLAAIQAKVDAEAQRQREQANKPPKQRTLQTEAPRAGAAPAASAPAPRLPTVPSAAEREAREAASRERYETRQRQVQAHREEAEHRTEQRALQKKPSATLPVPAGASAP